jgi:hypothetical protein
MILGSSAWFFVTLFIAKLCTVPKKEFITLITYFLENGDDLGDAFKEYIKFKPEKKKNFATNFDNIFENDNWGNINKKDNLSSSDSKE